MAVGTGGVYRGRWQTADGNFQAGDGDRQTVPAVFIAADGRWQMAVFRQVTATGNPCRRYYYQLFVSTFPGVMPV
jgi:hypothetical protein